MTASDIFYDFGAGKGNSMARAVQWWGGQGVGFENSASRRAIAVERGYNVQSGKMPDCMAGLPPDSARYSVINHVLEHIPEMRIGRKIIQEALRVSRDFVYVAGPWMESDYALMLAGCKWFCNDWPKDHPTRVTMLDVYSAARATGTVRKVAFYGREQVQDTGHALVYALDQEPLPSPYLLHSADCIAKPASRPMQTSFEEMCCLLFSRIDAASEVKAGFVKHNPNAELIMERDCHGRVQG